MKNNDNFGYKYRISSIKRRGAYLIFTILGAALIGGRRLKEGGAYFKTSKSGLRKRELGLVVPTKFQFFNV